MNASLVSYQTVDIAIWRNHAEYKHLIIVILGMHFWQQIFAPTLLNMIQTTPSQCMLPKRLKFIHCSPAFYNSNVRRTPWSLALSTGPGRCGLEGVTLRAVATGVSLCWSAASIGLAVAMDFVSMEWALLEGAWDSGGSCLSRLVIEVLLSHADGV